MPTPERSQSPSPSAVPSSNVQAAASTSLANEHLSYPSASAPAAQTPPASTKPRPLLQDRLYVGNLHPSVDEYTLLQVFSKFGKVSKLDFLFHKSGPMKGKPRGYAFVEFASKDDADKALTHANDKLLRGRKLVVTYAHQAPSTKLVQAVNTGE
ncbi:putative RNA-binding protein 18 [Grifola frondosa]|uniref:Probable RNA-binding protein 18 n=1 Tax=Grifola frondosa TaxID=5627 RepID=A0A1C7MN59_GRIFR|nr:putative RNA-binding protein 18 [Grifola frondosa]